MENETKKSCCSGDLRIFVIALLTAIITIALYHFGTSYCRMKCRVQACPPAPQVYIIGNQPCMPPRMMPMRPHFMPKAFPGKPGEFRKGIRRPFHGEFRKDGKRPFPGKDMKKAPEAPKAEAPAPAAPAPAPAK